MSAFSAITCKLNAIEVNNSSYSSIESLSESYGGVFEIFKEGFIEQAKNDLKLEIDTKYLEIIAKYESEFDSYLDYLYDYIIDSACTNIATGEILIEIYLAKDLPLEIQRFISDELVNFSDDCQYTTSFTFDIWETQFDVEAEYDLLVLD